MINLPADERFDCIFINSMLHHLTDGQVRSLLRSTANLLTPDGQVYIIDMYVPEERAWFAGSRWPIAAGMCVPWRSCRPSCSRSYW